MDKFWSKVDKTTTCWNWTGSTNDKGYGEIRVGGKLYKAHRFSWFLHTGEFPQNDMCHSCDNPSCVNPDHLFDGTRKENMEDCVSKGRQTSGSKNYHSLLEESQVMEIRGSNLPQKTLAEAYNVSKATISMIISRKTWRHI